jgi:hypothetical protein
VADTSNHQQVIENGSPVAVDNAVADTSNHQQVIENGSPTAVDNAVDAAPQGWYPEAEAAEREAHLAGQARTYLSDSDSASESLPGSRHMPTS